MNDVIVIGAGYAGVLAGNRLAPHARVRMLEPRSASVDRIRLHEVAAGTRTPARAERSLRGALDHRVSLTTGRATAVEPGLVRLDDGRELRARHILLANGRGASRDRSIDTLEDALAARDRLEALGTGGFVEIVGAGLTGVELAAEIAAAMPALHVRLIARGAVGGDLTDGAAAALLRGLVKLGVEVFSSPVGADVVLDATGSAPEPLGANSGFALDSTGRIRTDEFLRVLGADGAPLDGVWGAGDAIGVDGLPWLRGGCASAEPLAAEAADRIRGALTGREPEPISVGFVFRCISLGRRDGVIQFVTPDDRPRSAWVGGRAGAIWKDTISTVAWRAPAAWSRTYRPFPGPRR